MHVNAVDKDPAAFNVIKAGNKVYERCFSASGAADYRSCFSGTRCKRYIFYSGFLCTMVAERNMVERYIAALFAGRNAVNGVFDLRLYFQHFFNSVGRRLRARDHDEHHGHGDKGKQYLHCILQKSYQRTEIHISGVDPYRAEPEYSYD